MSEDDRPRTTWKVFAIRYATREGRRSAHFIGAPDHDGPMPMDYFTWVCRSAQRTVLVDTGFTREEAARRGRAFLRCPVESLSLLGIEAAAVEDVVLTHLHYDHVGNFGAFARARFHLQDREMAHATGRYMRVHCFAHSYNCADVTGVVRLNFDGRVRFHDGTGEIADGISVHRIGGHTPGLQCVRVRTAAGPVVLASDAAHYYEHLERNEPFAVVVDVAEMIDGYDTLRRLAGPGGIIVAGHDPQVLERFDPPSPEMAGTIVRIA